MKIVKNIIIVLVVLAVSFGIRTVLKDNGSGKIVDNILAHLEADKPISYVYTQAQGANSTSNQTIFNDKDNAYQKLTYKTASGENNVEVFVNAGDVKVYSDGKDMTSQFDDVQKAEYLTGLEGIHDGIVPYVELAKEAVSANIDSEVTKTDDTINISGTDTEGNKYNFGLAKDSSKFTYTAKGASDSIDVSIEFADSFDLPQAK